MTWRTAASNASQRAESGGNMSFMPLTAVNLSAMVFEGGAP
jgi:hypothetical protein